jgi:GNAT superfamily N-acetyltransferase
VLFMTSNGDGPKDFVLDTEQFLYQSFRENKKVRNFNSGSKDLDEFLNTDEVREYERQNLGKTTLVFYEGDLVGYFTICVDGLRLEYVLEKKTKRSYVNLGTAMIDKIPCLKIGRLAVAVDWQDKGIGRFLIKHIIGFALDISAELGLRLVIAEAKPEAMDFYIKCGFQPVVETKSQRKRRNRTVFLDLNELLADAD